MSDRPKGLRPGCAMRKVLILGIGNILQSDDGLGVYIVNRIVDSKVDLPDNVDIIDGGTAGFDLLSVMEGKDKIVIIDAVRAEGRPGSVYRFRPEHARETRASVSLHEVGIMEVIRTLRLLGSDPEIEVIGIVPEDISTTNISISSAVLESVPKTIELVLDAALH